ncbi:HNH endonuclease [Nocardia thailandica]
MSDVDEERELRYEIFDALRLMVEEAGGAVTRDALTSFTIRGEPLPLIDRNRGIRNPRSFVATLSVMSKPGSPYSDATVGESLYGYAYREGPIDRGDNAKLRKTFTTNLPFILLRWIEVGNATRYVPVFPVFTVADDPAERRIIIALDERLQRVADPLHLTPLERQYAQVLTTQRLHQPQFRSRVLIAYENRCAICRLGRPQLLEAAHIIPDKQEQGTADINNGLSLCRIHHTAFDRNLIGIAPDSTVHVGAELRRADDEGPIVEYGLKGLHRVKLQPPSHKKFNPSPDKLKARFEDFLAGVPSTPEPTPIADIAWPGRHRFVFSTADAAAAESSAPLVDR